VTVCQCGYAFFSDIVKSFIGKHVGFFIGVVEEKFSLVHKDGNPNSLELLSCIFLELQRNIQLNCKPA
jgi:hypothetical protein